MDRIKKICTGLLCLLVIGTGSFAQENKPQVVSLNQDSTAHPALIPLPQSLAWNKEVFDVSRCRYILINNRSLAGEAKRLQDLMETGGRKIPVRYGRYTTEENVIQLRLEKDSFNKTEAYSLDVRANSIRLSAATAHGIFNGIQTLRQLQTGLSSFAGCTIQDFPAFSWRGFMVDVARNYQSMELLKQQIDVLSHYKMNVFHFHVTDDIAWRLQVLRYPQLTECEFMKRNACKFYTISEVKELIQYCKDRYITFVPEIDMPGHSAAFTRAMGTDMQSAEGLKIIKSIIKEVCTTYDLTYFHIGADEVKIHNQQFLPEVTKLTRQLGKKVIGWNPGGNYDKSVIRQIWVETEQNKNRSSEKDSVVSLDSWHLYLNHMDPLNSVVTIFNRRLGNKVAGDDRLPGGEICMWTDRRLVQEQDMFYQNPVYPAIVTFAERSWQGGGTEGIKMTIGPDSSARARDFAAFENRLIEHKRRYFSTLPFPYVRQSHIHWKLFGPFPNGGQLASAFWPERPNRSPRDSVASLYATGATIWLRHFFGLSSWLEKPEENTTWYAWTQFWSDKDTTLAFWLGTKDISRSHADNSPPAGGWDYLDSKIWINSHLVEPPEWVNAGWEGGNWEEPLADEGFTYRPPVMVTVQKGWNNILVKAPVGAFKTKSWYRPVKWMFTVVPVYKAEGINWYASDLRFFSGDR